MKRAVSIALVIYAASLLSGCVKDIHEARIRSYQQQCREYGFKPHSEAMAQCVERLDNPPKS